MGILMLHHITEYNALRTVFRYAQKACGKVFFGGKLLFLIKIFNFHQKQQLPSDRLFHGSITVFLLAQKKPHTTKIFLRKFDVGASKNRRHWFLQNTVQSKPRP